MACCMAATVIDRPDGFGTAYRPIAANAGCGSAPGIHCLPSTLESIRCTPPHWRIRSQSASFTNTKGCAAICSADSSAASFGGFRCTCTWPGRFLLVRNMRTDCGWDLPSPKTRPVPGITPSSRTTISRSPLASGSGSIAQAGCLLSTAESVAVPFPCTANPADGSPPRAHLSRPSASRSAAGRTAGVRSGGMGRAATRLTSRNVAAPSKKTSVGGPSSGASTSRTSPRASDTTPSA